MVVTADIQIIFIRLWQKVLFKMIIGEPYHLNLMTLISDLGTDLMTLKDRPVKFSS